MWGAWKAVNRFSTSRLEKNEKVTHDPAVFMIGGNDGGEKCGCKLAKIIYYNTNLCSTCDG